MRRGTRTAFLMEPAFSAKDLRELTRELSKILPAGSELIGQFVAKAHECVSMFRDFYRPEHKEEPSVMASFRRIASIAAKLDQELAKLNDGDRRMLERECCRFMYSGRNTDADLIMAVPGALHMASGCNRQTDTTTTKR